MEFIFLTGMSGAGKSNAANAMEDLGFYCIDNIPPMLIPPFVDLANKGEIDLSKIAIVTDIRSGEAFENIGEVFDALEKNGLFLRLYFWMPLITNLFVVTARQEGSILFATNTVLRWKRQ